MQIQSFFGPRFSALAPQSLSRPGIRTNDSAAVQFDPGVVEQDAAGTEKLHLAQLAAYIDQEAKANVHVVVRLWQTIAHHQYPVFDRRRNEQLLSAGKRSEEHTS